jgi:desulfoferrodoxin (superoxide reductase-like protein)
MEENITIKTSDGTDHNMTKDTFIRWMCLVELVQLAEEKADELKIDLEKYDWVKPLEFRKYINARFKGMEVDIEAESNSKMPMLQPMEEGFFRKDFANA